MQNKFPKKSKVFYINTALLLVAVVLVVNMVSPRGHELIKRAVAAVTGITGDGTINKLVRFAGATNPSNFVGDSVIYDNGTNVGIGTTNPLNNLQIGTQTALSTATPVTLSLGGTYSSTAGANPKLKLFDNVGTIYGLGVSAGQMDFMSPTGAGFGWYINGVSKMTMNLSGNVGIGTTGPTSLFTVHTGTDANLGVRTMSGGGTGTGIDLLSYNDANNALDVMEFEASRYNFRTGKVGIGTTGPALILEAKGAPGNPATSGTAQTGIMRLSNNVGVGSIDFGFGGTSGTGWIQAVSSANLATNFDLGLNPNGGNVGIGTTGPVSKLTVMSPGGVADGLTFSMREGNNPTYGWDYTLDDLTDGDLILNRVTAGTRYQMMTFQRDTGNVGIGTTTPGAKLDVGGGLRLDGAAAQTATDNRIVANGSAGWMTINSPSALYLQNMTMAPTYINPSGGNVGIGTTAPGSRLTVVGTGTTISATGGGTGVYATGTDFGVGGYGGTYGVYGFGTTYGVQGSGGTYGVRGYGSSYGGFFSGSTGVYGTSTSSYGIGAYGIGTGANSTGVQGTGTYFGVVGSGGTYDFYASGAGTNYGPFTGSHEAILASDFPENFKPGMIVSTTGEVKKREGSLSSTLPTIKLTDTANDGTVFGVLTMISDLPSEHWYTQKVGEQAAIVNALGDGQVWVTNYGGEINNGDRIISSPIAGYGMKEDGRYPLNYIVAKITENIDWSKVTETVEYGGATYKAYLAAGIYDTLSMVPAQSTALSNSRKN